jgi:hypothetical protein
MKDTADATGSPVLGHIFGAKVARKFWQVRPRSRSLCSAMSVAGHGDKVGDSIIVQCTSTSPDSVSIALFGEFV